MAEKVKPAPSCSMVLSKIPLDFDKEEIESYFRSFSPEKIIFHYASPKLFTGRASIVFPDQKVAAQCVAKYGKNIGDDMILHYAFLPNNFSDTHPLGEIPMRTLQDDTDACETPFAPQHHILEWRNYTEFPTVIPQTTVVLSLRYNNIAKVDCVFDQLTWLNLKGNEIREISSSTSFPLLRYCVLSFNFISKLPDLTVFSPRIEHLDLSYNQIENLPPTLDQLLYLTFFDISHNKIKKLPKLPPNLSRFSAHCNLLEESEDTQPINSLRELNLWRNYFTETPHFARGHIDKLSITFNRIRSFEGSYLSEALEQVSLCMNGLTEIPASLFHSPTLGKLILYGNKITKIPEDFSSCSIEYLDVSENPISTLPVLPICLTDLRISFCQFENLDFIRTPNTLTRLHATHNKIKTIPDLLPKIEELLVGSNLLTELPPIHKDFLTAVTLDVSHNEITKFDVAAPLRLADFSFTKITEIPPNFFNLRTRSIFTGNNINQQLDAKKLFKVETLDITKTGIQINGEISGRIRDLFVDYNGQEQVDRKHSFFSSTDAVGYSDMIGVRNEMEDASVVRQDFPGGPLFGIFDGHGGDHCSHWAATSFPVLMQENSKSFSQIVADFQQLMISINERSGTTMDLVQVFSEKFWIAHIGDGKTAVFKENGQLKFATTEQHPAVREDMERLKALKIPLKRNRIGGMLAMSASLGDVQVPGMSREPVISEVMREKDDRWLVIACDGLWDDVEPDQVFETIKLSKNPSQAASLLRNQAYSRGSEDNISVIVVDLFKL